MSLRLLGIIAEISVGTFLVAWGLAAARRPSCWTWRGARWWVGWTSAPVARTHGVAVALVGAGLLVCAVATALTAPATPIPVASRDLQLIGLGVVLLGGALLAATHPAPGDPGLVGPETPAVEPTTDSPPRLTAAP
ncbi:hypothetical protein LQ327_14925 [Actinomycetospora endophytica]|uniref:Uncharacterized protein n=1 Tax=Actinomycetospora endophytica TaxID=2291215 RepID=A0ABS8PCE6_9PSEU|nr:hypothetical protein [Actinomycetospora endophytica]MCD2194664.1 hypothetical protein [Actinomycetospora endophytica]